MSVRPVPGPRLKRCHHMFHRLRRLNARYVHDKAAAVPNLAVVDDSPKKTGYGRVFDFFALFLAESSIHGLNHLVAKRRVFTERVKESTAIHHQPWFHLSGIPSFTGCSNNPVFRFVIRSVCLVKTWAEFLTASPRIRHLLSPGLNFIWALVIISAVFGSVWLSLDIWKRYNESPTVISMERNFMDWHTTLPSGTICLDQKVDEVKLQAYVDSVKEFEDKEKLKEFLRNLANATYDNFREMTDIPNNPIKSGEYLDAILQFYYHSPHDVLDASYKGYHIPENMIKIVMVGALTTYTTAEARSLSIQQRKCRFSDENYLRISPVYTFNYCRLECRMRIARRKCDCIPHFYRNTGQAKICDVQGMRCLGNYSELLTKLVDPATGKKYPCKCLPECDQVSYYLEKEVVERYNL
ncbi:hypothetical protein Cfor_03333 [Coptotermes formosanus]|uniref:Sodium channel protein Nach n=1 Tax=Coptotermes formosanus TaxID=36987 RepID=A0A6L2PE85_COPFO|nr:hypothetical protein Cfor_03333 [Coptotermes formosanus]